MLVEKIKEETKELSNEHCKCLHERMAEWLIENRLLVLELIYWKKNYLFKGLYTKVYAKCWQTQ